MVTKRGVVFTIDAMLAVAIAATMFGSVLYYANQVNSLQYDEQNLATAAMNTLSVLEKDRTLWRTVGNANISELQIFLNATEFQLCTNITIYDNTGVLQHSALKDGCTHGAVSIHATRSFITGHYAPWYATAEVWFDDD